MGANALGLGPFACAGLGTWDLGLGGSSGYRRCELTAQGVPQSNQLPRDLIADFNDLSTSPFIEQIEAPRKIDQVEQFAAGRERDVQETQIVGLSRAGAALDDVGRNRHRRTTDLAEETVTFALRKVRRTPVGQYGKLIC